MPTADFGGVDLPNIGLTSPLANRRSDPRTLSRSRELSGPELAAAVLRASENPDVKNLAGSSLAFPAKLAAARPIAVEHVLRGGTRVRATVFKLSVTRLLAHHFSTGTPLSKPRSTARLWRADGDRSLLVGISDGGQVQPSPEKLGTQHPGGDRGGGEASFTAIDLSCVLNLAQAGGGCSIYFYTLPETSVRPAPPGCLRQRLPDALSPLLRAVRTLIQTPARICPPQAVVVMRLALHTS
jgi:hypothetical protein